MDTPSPSDPGPAPEPQIPAAPAAPDTVVAIKIFGLGTAGNAVLELLIAGGLPAAACVAVDARSLATSPAGEKVQLEGKPARSSSHAEEPDPAALEQQADRLKALCQGTEVVFLVAGLGGTAGTSVGPVVARVARECGALAIAFVTTPFECEGSRRSAEHLTRSIMGLRLAFG